MPTCVCNEGFSLRGWTCVTKDIVWDDWCVWGQACLSYRRYANLRVSRGIDCGRLGVCKDMWLVPDVCPTIYWPVCHEVLSLMGYVITPYYRLSRLEMSSGTQKINKLNEIWVSTFNVCLCCFFKFWIFILWHVLISFCKKMLYWPSVVYGGRVLAIENNRLL